MAAHAFPLCLTARIAARSAHALSHLLTQPPLVERCFCKAVNVKAPGFDRKDDQKLQFTWDALHNSDPFSMHTAVHADVERALEWHAARKPAQVHQQRERIMRQLESEADKLWFALIAIWVSLFGDLRLCHRRDGSCSDWVKHACPHTRQDVLAL